MLLEEYRLIIFDIDGTLIKPNKKEISQETSLMMFEISKNITISVATSRNYWATVYALKELVNINSMICNDGRHVVDDSLTSYVLGSINCKIVELIMQMAPNVFDYIIEDGYHVYSSSRRAGLKYSYFFGINKKIRKVSELTSRTHILSITVIPYNECVRYIEDIIKSFEDQINIRRRNSTGWYHLETRNISKKDGLIKLCNILGISLKDTIFIGDGKNDVDMFLNSGYSVAVENAIDECKNLADRVLDCELEEYLSMLINS